MRNSNTDVDILTVVVRNREKILKEGQYSSLSSTNEAGVFDILPRHANFITIIRDFITLRKNDGSEETIRIDQGAMKVIENSVHAYVDLPSVPVR